jgi:hypothetical protein
MAEIEGGRGEESSELFPLGFNYFRGVYSKFYFVGFGPNEGRRRIQTFK